MLGSCQFCLNSVSAWIPIFHWICIFRCNSILYFEFEIFIAGPCIPAVPNLYQFSDCVFVWLKIYVFQTWSLCLAKIIHFQIVLIWNFNSLQWHSNRIVDLAHWPWETDSWQLQVPQFLSLLRFRWVMFLTIHPLIYDAIAPREVPLDFVMVARSLVQFDVEGRDLGLVIAQDRLRGV